MCLDSSNTIEILATDCDLNASLLAMLYIRYLKIISINKIVIN